MLPRANFLPLRRASLRGERATWTLTVEGGIPPVGADGWHRLKMGHPLGRGNGELRIDSVKSISLIGSRCG
jgi:hypothetical protein